MLRRPDVFHAAVAGAPVTEWRLYDTFYTERYLGNPAEHADAYDASSLLPLADRLTRPLLLIHGLADDNVVAAHTLQLSAALLAAGKPHEVLPLVGVTHMTNEEVVAENLLLHQLEFLRRSLGLAAMRTEIRVMNERLSELYHGVAVHATADREHMAALELLALVMLADRHVDQSEVDTIRSISEDWRGGAFSFDQYLGPAVARAREAVEQDGVTELLDDIDRRISSRILRRALVLGCPRGRRCRRSRHAGRGIDPRRRRRSLRLSERRLLRAWFTIATPTIVTAIPTNTTGRGMFPSGIRASVGRVRRPR